MLNQRFIIIIHDSIMAAFAWTLAILVRYNFQPDAYEWGSAMHILPIVVLVQSVVFWRFDVHRGIWRFTSMPDVALILRSTLLGTLAIVLALMLYNRLENVPRSSLVFYPFLLIFFIGMPRLLYRLWHEHSFRFLLTPSPHANKRVLVLGAGTSGDMLVRDMLRNPTCGYIPVGFLDDQLQLYGGRVQGVPIVGAISELEELVEEYKVDMAIIAMPSATDEQMQRVVELCEHCHIPFRTLPKLDNLTSQQIKLNDLRDVSIDDLLGRAKVQLDWSIIKVGIRNKVIMVTGGGGSIGSELCCQIARLDPAALIIFERSEFNLYHIEMQLQQAFPNLDLYACLGDVTDSVAVKHVFKQHHPHIVFHAAAYKHVPMLQFQTREAARNNVLGTRILAETAAYYKCEKFVLISTDKAVNPANVMGATKRAAEILCQELNHRVATKFITVRFGNVLGSAGSVVPLFKKQIAAGGPVTVTHPDINRYFMTIPEACQLILQAGAMSRGGEIFVLDMGKPIKIKYLAEQMIRLSGKIPNEDIDIVYTGLRAGEKLHEELFYNEEKFNRTAHEKIFLAAYQHRDWIQLNHLLEQLDIACDNYTEVKIKTLLKALVPEMLEG